jgi:hypothetical protein
VINFRTAGNRIQSVRIDHQLRAVFQRQQQRRLQPAGLTGAGPMATTCLPAISSCSFLLQAVGILFPAGRSAGRR